MNSAVDDHSGPLMRALASWPVQLSPAAIEVRLCWLYFSSMLPGMMIEKRGRVPWAASAVNCGMVDMCCCWAVSQQSASDGQIAHPSLAGGLAPSEVFQLSPAASGRSRMDGTHWAGVALNAPPKGYFAGFRA